MTLTPEEGRRLHVLTLLEGRRISLSQAAEALGVSPRQVRRLRVGMRRDGPEALIHGNRGRPAPHRLRASCVRGSGADSPFLPPHAARRDVACGDIFPEQLGGHFPGAATGCIHQPAVLALSAPDAGGSGNAWREYEGISPMKAHRAPWTPKLDARVPGVEAAASSGRRAIRGVDGLPSGSDARPGPRCPWEARWRRSTGRRRKPWWQSTTW